MAGRRKNFVLLTVLLLLAGLTAVLLLSGERKEETGAGDYFAISSVSGISRIVMEGSDFTHVFTRGDKGWRINGRYAADENLMEVLQIILNKAIVKRPAANAQKESIDQLLAASGVKVSVYGTEDQLLRAFTVAGSDNRKVSYFYDEDSDKAYLMYIPGYDTYLAGIFGLALNEWRDKLIFSSSWRSLRSVAVHYPDDTTAGFRIAFEKDFFTISGIESIDTSRMMRFLENVEEFRAEKVLEKQPESLSGAEPFLTISVEDIDTAKTNTLYLYPRDHEDPYLIGTDQKDRVMRIRHLDVEPFMVTKDFFKR